MASIAHQVILHPFITSSLKVGSTSVGRDKLYRAIQYFSRFLVWFLQSNGYDKLTITRFNNLKSALGVSRKLFRLGKPLEHLQAALKATKTTSDPVVSTLAIGRQLSYSMYLFNDMLIWADKIKFIFLDKTKLAIVNQRAARFWMAGIAMNLVSSILQLYQIRKKVLSLKRDKYHNRNEEEKEDHKKYQIKTYLKQSTGLRWQLIQDTCDILSPTSTLGYHSLNDGVIGAAGVVSSILGLRAQINKVLTNGAAK